ncbi:MAG TPA: FtsX-like permease family protein [Acidimicrobiales bacterium]|nr:FtsX-like permease family protein [Acidimicrobiales bacterium]
MWRVTIRGLMAKKLRLLTTALAITLGVAFMAGTLVLTDTMAKVFDDLFADVNRGTDAFVRGETVFKSDFGDVRSRIPASLVSTVQGAQGVAAAEGSVQGYAQLVKANGKALSTGQSPNLGGSWGTVPELNPWRIVEGRAPQGFDEILIDKGAADKGDFSVGQRVKVLLKGPTQEFTIVGIAKFGTVDAPAGASFVSFTINTAQQVLSEPGQIDSISAVAQPGVSQEQLAANIKKVVPANVEVLTGKQITKENQNDIKQGLRFFNTFLLVFAGVAVFVGMFIIYNTFSILVAQRGRELALLRAIGASRRQVLGSVLVEGVVVGLIASLVGLGLGVLVAMGLTALLSALGIDLPSGSLVLLPRTVVASLVVGVGITVASALLPARRASRIPPVAAMREVAIDTSASSRKRVVIGLVALAIGALLLAGGLARGGGKGAIQVGLSALVVFVSATILGPVIAKPVSRLVGAPLPRLRGMSGTLARENAVRNPRRTSSTAAALMIGVGIVVFILVLAASLKQSISDITGSQLKADYIVNTTGGFTNSVGFSPDVATQISTLPEVQSVSGMRFGAMQVDGSTKFVFAVDPTTIEDVFDFVNVTGSIEDLSKINTIAVDKKVAEKNGWTIGSTIDVTFASETAPMQIVALIDGAKAFSNWGMGIPTYELHFADQFDSQVFVKLKPGADAAAFEQGANDILKSYPTAELQTPEEFKNSVASQINQLVSVIYALLFLAIIIALLGIANTLALSIYERRHEIGLLRAVGMTRRQVRSSVRWESVIIALFGTALGLVIGIAFGAAIVRSLRSLGFTGFVIPLGQLVAVAIIAALAGVLAAIQPARKAAKLDILASIATE